MAGYLASQVAENSANRSSAAASVGVAEHKAEVTVVSSNQAKVDRALSIVTVDGGTVLA